MTFDELCRGWPDPRALRRRAILGFHVKFNAQNDRLLFILRAMDTRERHGRLKRHPSLVTLRPDGSDITVAMPDSIWSRGGHHPNWHPDGRRCLMNLKLDGQHLRLVTFRYDGSGLGELAGGIAGSGHPSYSPDGKEILTDAYLSDLPSLGVEPPASGAVPLRLIDAAAGVERVLVWAPVGDAGRGALRCDPHPAWREDGRQVCFNAAPGGRRQVFVAELEEATS